MGRKEQEGEGGRRPREHSWGTSPRDSPMVLKLNVQKPQNGPTETDDSQRRPSTLDDDADGQAGGGRGWLRCPCARGQRSCTWRACAARGRLSSSATRDSDGRASKKSGHININCRRSARIPRVGAGAPSRGRWARTGMWGGGQRPSRGSARTSDRKRLCSCQAGRGRRSRCATGLPPGYRARHIRRKHRLSEVRADPSLRRRPPPLPGARGVPGAAEEAPPADGASAVRKNPRGPPSIYVHAGAAFVRGKAVRQPPWRRSFQLPALPSHFQPAGFGRFGPM